MNNFDNGHHAMLLHKSREQEFLAEAEKKRTLKAIREVVLRRGRRTVRINNDPAR